MPGATERFRQPEPSRPLAPSRLGASPPLRGEDAPIEVGAAATGAVTLTVLLSGAADVEASGLATFHTLTGGDFRWHPLRDSREQADGTRAFQIEARRDTPLTLTFAAERAHARHGYIARERRSMLAPASETELVVAMSAVTHSVRLLLPANVERAGPLRLQRVDDRQWLPMLYTTSGIELRRGAETTLQLGAGTYELQAPLAPNQRQTFTVPDVDVVTVTLGNAPAQSDRR